MAAGVHLNLYRCFTAVSTSSVALAPNDVKGVKGGMAQAEYWQSTYGRSADSTETSV